MRRAFASMLLTVACNRAEVAREEPTPTPAPAAPESKAEVIVDEPIADDEPPAPAPPPKPREPSPTRALVVTGGELKELGPDGRTATIAAVPGMLSCDVDDERNVVWLASARDLSAYDLDDGTLHAITKGASSE
ncbi:MAG TPA: hypothetical protein VG755_06025, partial [Nannocystaceae bacterium]|nr:hypothetical protein [Nannocystaceae bacterium]